MSKNKGNNYIANNSENENQKIRKKNLIKLRTSKGFTQEDMRKEYNRLKGTSYKADWYSKHEWDINKPSSLKITDEKAEVFADILGCPKEHITEKMGLSPDQYDYFINPARNPSPRDIQFLLLLKAMNYEIKFDITELVDGEGLTERISSDGKITQSVDPRPALSDKTHIIDVFYISKFSIDGNPSCEFKDDNGVNIAGVITDVIINNMSISYDAFAFIVKRFFNYVDFTFKTDLFSTYWDYVGINNNTATDIYKSARKKENGR